MVMKTKKNIEDFVSYETQSIKDVLNKINKNQKGIIFLINSSGKLTGSFSDGDFRRLMLRKSQYNLDSEIRKVMNKKVTFFEESKFNENNYVSQINSNLKLIPLTDKDKIVSLYLVDSERCFEIGNFKLTENSPTFIIAEIGNNHQGDVAFAKEMVESAIESGADCVKFQMRDMKSLYNFDEDSKDVADLGSQYTFDLLSKYQLSNSELFEVFDFCKEKGVIPLCTPWDLSSLEKLNNYGIDAFKIASADLTNHALLEKAASTGKPLICSTGMSTEQEIKSSIEIMKKHKSKFVLLHCNSTYPAPLRDINLNYLSRLKDLTKFFVGYSGHERGINIAISSVALGAKIVEKHFTFDKKLEGNDHKVSLLPEEFKNMVDGIREIEEAAAPLKKRVLTQGEMINRDVLAKSLIAKEQILKGTTISRNLIGVKSPGNGLQPNSLNKLVGKKAFRDIKKGDFFYKSDIEGSKLLPRNYKFSRPYGIPVRFHDFSSLEKVSKFDFFEFHLSYSDLEVNIDPYFKGNFDQDLIVHSPELFKEDHVLDLASPDNQYLKKSIKNLDKVCSMSSKIKKYFKNSKRTQIVVNAGGFSADGFIKKDEAKKLYEKIYKSLSKVKLQDTEIIIQSMPPFPWHFGGQRYHNIFVDPEEISNFCRDYGYRICLDVSHAQMACSFFGWELDQYVNEVSDFVAHLHISDALGYDGEGVKFGEGDVDFLSLSKVLKNRIPDIGFIPEVWQGHVNFGQGFWEAFEFLEDIGF